MIKILVLNGPNLNLLGTRETKHYGEASLAIINQELARIAQDLQIELITHQSNAEYELLERIQQTSKEKINFIILNPAAFTHTSIALRDALLAVKVPFIEVHLSNIHARETFRHHSYFSDIAIGVISGFGGLGYQLALQAAHHYLEKNQAKG